MGSIARLRPLLGLAALAALLGTATVPLAAQATGTLRGTVTEAGSRRPLSGAQVIVEGTSRRAVTNEAGEYSLTNLPAGPAQVRAELIGHTPAQQAVTIADGQTARADFVLAASALQLDALVVTGTAGATQKRAIGNAVAKIDAANVVASAPVTNVTQVLQGRTAGITVLQGSGLAGSNQNIRIRGAGSMNAGNRPIFVVDGVRITSGGQGGFGTSNSTVQTTSALDAINPEDIESIEVIKGPAAATLYGAEAASGVIQIITKKGKSGQQGLQWSAKAERGQVDWHIAHPMRYTLCTEARIKATSTYPGCSKMDPAAPAASRLLSDQVLNRDPNALRTGDVQSYSLSARGGGERYSFYLAGDREDEEGVYLNNYYNRTSGRANFAIYPTDLLDISVSMGYARSDAQMPLSDNASNGLLRNAYRARPGGSYPYQDGYLGLGSEIINQFDNRILAERFTIGATANYKPATWFSNRLTVGLDMNSRRNTQFYAIDTTGLRPWGASVAAGYIGHYVPQTHNWTFDYAGTLTKDLSADVSSSTSFGMQLNAYRFESYTAEGVGLTTNRTRLVSSAATTYGGESFSEQNSLGFFAQEQIGWKDRLFVTGAVRVDDNSAFGEDFSTVVYPKLSASYMISEEGFFNLPAVDQLKLRMAWGQAGNAPAPFSADRTFTSNTVTLADGSAFAGLTTAAYGNPDLKAETGEEIEVGFDASLFQERLGVEATYYNKRTRDALVSIDVAPSSGFGGTRLENVGEISNQGFELALFGTPVQTRAVTWDARVTAATNKNELTSFGTREDDVIFGAFRDVQKYREGFPLGAYWGIDVKRDESGSPIFTKTSSGALVASLGEEQYVGSSAPTREMSLTNTVTLFGNLRLYAFMDYKGGHYLWNATRWWAETVDLNGPVWNDPNTSEEQRAIFNARPTLPFIEKADFVKLREVSATYTVPSSLTRRIGTEQMSFTLSGRNLKTWTDYQGLDPELNFYGDANFSRADYMSVPPLRKWVATVNFSF